MNEASEVQTNGTHNPGLAFATGELLSTKTAAEHLKEVTDRAFSDIGEARAKAELELRDLEARVAELRELLAPTHEQLAGGKVRKIRHGSRSAKPGVARAPKASPKPVKAKAAPAEKAVKAKPVAEKTERLPRRSASDIANGIERVMELLRGKDEGMRAEEIKAELGIDKRELPAILKAGLGQKIFRSTGNKRSTTYFLRAGRKAAQESAQSEEAQG